MDNEYQQLESYVRKFYASVAWTHKIQEKQAEIYTSKQEFIAIINIIASSITSVGVFSLVFTDQFWVKVSSAIISFITVFIGAFQKTFDLYGMAKECKSVATKLVILRDDLELLLLKIRLKKHPLDELLTEFQELQKKVHEVYQEQPKSTNKAVKKAGIALEVTQDNTFSDQEIDMMLPEELRKGNANE